MHHMTFISFSLPLLTPFLPWSTLAFSSFLLSSSSLSIEAGKQCESFPHSSTSQQNLTLIMGANEWGGQPIKENIPSCSSLSTLKKRSEKNLRTGERGQQCIIGQHILLRCESVYCTISQLISQSKMESLSCSLSRSHSQSFSDFNQTKRVIQLVSKLHTQSLSLLSQPVRQWFSWLVSCLLSQSVNGPVNNSVSVSQSISQSLPQSEKLWSVSQVARQSFPPSERL